MRNIFFIIPILLIAVSCKKKPSDVPQPSPVLMPSKATLMLPKLNEPCTSGAIISATESIIQFKWGKAENTDSYDLVVKNLLTNISTTYSAGANLQQEVTLPRNAPFSWYVLSKSAIITLPAQSDTWKFYTSGPANVFYAPYPADEMIPAIGANIAATNNKITLDWNGSDADNDIVAYDIYLGTTATPVLLSANVANSILADVTVSANTVYYWRVVTKDGKGNTSDSGVYQFEIN